ncbi:uncharacterized protein RSE6_10432 [Rhynchosporium secalis]|uniref:Uncharacterized protein n=1 Tax=Rhynchosporium secalis TaxID=38038 RepID=A0A1E1MKE0_RHYSE|nr:uncharacterized protein RSE6_10432 [Rhynchosporium secalis]
MTTFYIQGSKTIEFSAQNLTSLQVIDIPRIRYLRLYGIERIGNGRQLESGGLVSRTSKHSHYWEDCNHEELCRKLQLYRRARYFRRQHDNKLRLGRSNHHCNSNSIPRAQRRLLLKCQNWHQRRHRCPLYSRSLPRDVSQPAASLVPVERTGDRMAGNLWSKEVSLMSAVSDAEPAQVHHDSCARSPAPPDYTP